MNYGEKMNKMYVVYERSFTSTMHIAHEAPINHLNLKSNEGLRHSCLVTVFKDKTVY